MYHILTYALELALFPPTHYLLQNFDLGLRLDEYLTYREPSNYLKMQASPVQVHGYLTPLPSPNKRRYLLRQSEKTDSKTGTGVISIYQVVRPDLKVQSQVAIDLINQIGYVSVNTSSITGTIQYPAMMDLKATRKELVNNTLPAAAKSIKDTEDKISRFQLKDKDAPKRLTRILDFQQRVLDKSTKRVAMLEQLTLVFGDVLVSSGDAVSRSIPGCAIVGMPASKVPQLQLNTLPSTEEVARVGK